MTDEQTMRDNFEAWWEHNRESLIQDTDPRRHAEAAWKASRADAVSASVETVAETLDSVWKATTRFGNTCHFGTPGMARAWGGKGAKIEKINLKPIYELTVVPDAAQPTAPVEVTDAEIADLIAEHSEWTPQGYGIVDSERMTFARALLAKTGAA